MCSTILLRSAHLVFEKVIFVLSDDACLCWNMCQYGYDWQDNSTALCLENLWEGQLIWDTPKGGSRDLDHHYRWWMTVHDISPSPILVPSNTSHFLNGTLTHILSRCFQSHSYLALFTKITCESRGYFGKLGPHSSTPNPISHNTLVHCTGFFPNCLHW